MLTSILWISVGLLALPLYFFPTFKAWNNKQSDLFWTVLALNFLIGWTVIGWALAYHLADWKQNRGLD